jgi:hypothetical protein
MKRNLAALALGLSTLMASPAFADDDRPPTAEERTKIEEVLKAEGFTAWKEIEFDDNRWEVDDATHSDGKVYDLYLSAKDLSVVFKTLDD